MTFEQWWKKFSGGEYQPENYEETKAAWDAALEDYFDNTWVGADG